MGLSLAVAGDVILNRRVSVCEDEGLRSLLAQFRDADLGFAHLETNLLDYDDPAVYPAAEAGGTWMRSPPEIAEELRWAGFDVVSHASNHALDFGYGGLESTWAALEAADVGYAGTGRNLAEARGPEYRETAEGRVGVVSMSTSFTDWSRAGEARRDMQGRPGVNPLGYHYELGPEALEQVVDLATAMGLWVTPTDDGYILNPPGLHNTVDRFDAGDDPGVRPVLDERDREGNLRAVEEAARQADVAVAHVHTHAWDTTGELCDPAPFLPPFARDCVDAGADVVVCQGAHTPLRGIERYGDGIVFYDPGDFFMMSDTVERLPSEFYDRYGGDFEGHPADAMPGELLEERGISSQFDEDADDSDSDYGGAALSPPGGYFSGEVLGALVPVCEFGDDHELERVELHPAVLRASSALYTGVPTRATGERARDIVRHVDDLSDAFGTDVTEEDGTGVVEL
jgi:poly-gamma-glutamate synthesis protein (capsule biosynthesis protein)